jgi:hypothetical protein
MEDNEVPYSFTAKTPAGNLFTVRGRTFEEFKANIIEARNGNAPAALKAFEATAGPGGSQGLPQQQYCNHGAMRYIPNGKYGPFWACPLNRDDPNKCKARP